MSALGDLGDGVDNILGTLGNTLSNMVNSIGAAGTKALVSDITGQPIVPVVAPSAGMFGGMSPILLIGLGVGALFLFGGMKGRRR